MTLILNYGHKEVGRRYLYHFARDRIGSRRRELRSMYIFYYQPLYLPFCVYKHPWRFSIAKIPLHPATYRLPFWGSPPPASYKRLSKWFIYSVCFYALFFFNQLQTPLFLSAQSYPFRFRVHRIAPAPSLTHSPLFVLH